MNYTPRLSKYILLVCMLLTPLLHGCKKSNSVMPSSLTFNGVTYIGQSNFIVGPSVRIGYWTAFTGRASNGDTLTVNIFSPVNPGTASFDTTLNCNNCPEVFIDLHSNGNVFDYYGVQGSITTAKDSSDFSGTFKEYDSTNNAVPPFTTAQATANIYCPPLPQMNPGII